MFLRSCRRAICFATLSSAFSLPIGCAFLPNDAFAQSLTPSVGAPAGMQWVNTFDDNFDSGENLSTNWSFASGNNNGWGNGEAESYTSTAASIISDPSADDSAADSTDPNYTSNSVLDIKATGTQSGNSVNYTSARMSTNASFSQTYGLFEFRAKFPATSSNGNPNGLWPALWMMPETSHYGAWPESGEIDVMESNSSNQIVSTLHAGSEPNEDSQEQDAYNFPNGQSITGWHTYDVEWQVVPDSYYSTAGPGSNGDGEDVEFTFYVDGHSEGSILGGWPLPDSDPNDQEAPFNKPFYIIMNMAVGGDFTGYATPGVGTYNMEVDYVRAYSLGAIPTPEPAAIGMLLTGGVLYLRRRRSSENVV